MSEALIALLTDFGTSDHYVGVVKAVLAITAPSARTLDLCHAVPPQNVRTGAFLLRAAVEYLPAGTIVLAIVDPGVGGTRRALAVSAGGLTFVGPDNGLFSWALGRLEELDRCVIRQEHDALWLGDRCRAIVLDRPEYWRQPVSTTFHGRDLFAPVAAHLATGAQLDALGTQTDSIVGLRWPTPERLLDGRLRAEVIHVDSFGNLVTSVAPEAGSVQAVELAGRLIMGVSQNFVSDRPLIALIGSSGLLEIAAPNGSAAALLGVREGAAVMIVLDDLPGEPGRAGVSSA